MVGPVVIAFFASQAMLNGHHILQISFSHGGVARAVFGGAVYLMLIGVFAMAIGAIVRNTAGGIAAFAGLFFVIPPLLNILPTSWNNAISPWLPDNAARVDLPAHARRAQPLAGRRPGALLRLLRARARGRRGAARPPRHVTARTGLPWAPDDLELAQPQAAAGRRDHRRPAAVRGGRHRGPPRRRRRPGSASASPRHCPCCSAGSGPSSCLAVVTAVGAAADRRRRLDPAVPARPGVLHAGVDLRAAVRRHRRRAHPSPPSCSRW